jgi:hypothetical protein
MRCGEIKIFKRSEHDENYDFARDPERTGKILVVSTFLLFGILSLIIANGWQSFVI